MSLSGISFVWDPSDRRGCTSALSSYSHTLNASFNGISLQTPSASVSALWASHSNSAQDSEFDDYFADAHAVYPAGWSQTLAVRFDWSGLQCSAWRVGIMKPTAISMLHVAELRPKACYNLEPEGIVLFIARLVGLTLRLGAIARPLAPPRKRRSIGATWLASVKLSFFRRVPGRSHMEASVPPRENFRRQNLDSKRNGLHPYSQNSNRVMSLRRLAGPS